MTKTLTKTNDYAEFLNTLKTRIRSARILAARVVNKELIERFEKKIQATLARVWGKEEKSEIED